MSLVSATSSAGMRAAMNAVNASAHRIAAANAATQAVAASARPAPGTGPAAVPSLEQSMIQQLAAKHAFLSNLSVFRAADEMTGALLDLHG